MKAFKITCIVFTTIALLLTIFATGMYIGVELSTYIQDYNDLKSTNSELQIDINQLNSENSMLKDEVNKLETTNASLETLVTQLNGEIVNLTVDLTKLEASNKALETLITQLNDENANLKIDMTVLETTNTMLENAITQLKEENSNLKIDMDALKITINILDDMFTQLENENKDLMVDIAVLETTVTELTSSLNELQNGITQRAKLVNSFWEYSSGRRGMYGNLYFNDLSNVEKIEVSYKDWILNDIDVGDSTICLDASQNTAVVSFYYLEEYVDICVLEIIYTDGRSETVYEQIGLG